VLLRRRIRTTPGLKERGGGWTPRVGLVGLQLGRLNQKE